MASINTAIFSTGAIDVGMTIYRRLFKQACRCFAALVMRYAFLIATLVAVSAPTEAEVFDSFDDGIDNGWTHYSPLASHGAGGIYTLPTGFYSREYRIQAPASPNPAMLGPARAGSYRPEIDLNDFHVGVNLMRWNNTINQQFGPIVRGRELGTGTTDGYALLYQPPGRLPSGSFGIVRIDNDVITPLGPGSSIALTIDPTRIYRMQLEGIGPALTGLIYDYIAPSPQIPLAVLRVTDSTYTHGTIGLLVAATNQFPMDTADASFDYFYVVPESPGLQLVAAGAATIGLRRRRLKRGGWSARLARSETN